MIGDEIAEEKADQHHCPRGLCPIGDHFPSHPPELYNFRINVMTYLLQRDLPKLKLTRRDCIQRKCPIETKRPHLGRFPDEIPRVEYRMIGLCDIYDAVVCKHKRSEFGATVALASVRLYQIDIFAVQGAKKHVTHLKRACTAN